MSAIMLKHIDFAYDGHSIFQNLNLQFPLGQCSAVMAPSGRGKTTLLFLLAGLLRPDCGTIEYISEGVAEQYRCSMVFQEGRLVNSLSVRGNIKLVTDSCADSILQEMFASLGLIEENCLEEYALFVKKKVSSLSGGEKQRVAIARALVSDYDVLLLDEPFTGLDESRKEQIASYLQQKTTGKTVIMVTHDEEEARLMNASVYRL